MYHRLCTAFGNELDIILHTNLERIISIGNAKIAEGVHKVRKGDIAISPGYDGEYGKVSIWEKEKKQEPQLSLDL